MTMAAEGTAAMNRQFAIFAIGFSERTQQVLQMMLERFGDLQYALAPLDRAEILLVNGDIPSVKEAVDAIRAQRPCPAVVLCTRERTDIPDAHCLLNPISARAFMDILQLVAARLQPALAPAGNAAAETAAEAAAEAAAERREAVMPEAMPEAAMPEAPVFPAPPRPRMPPPGPAAEGKSPKSKDREKTGGGTPAAAGLLEKELGGLDNRGRYLRDIDLNDAKQVAGLYFNPRGYLCEYLREILSANRDAAVAVEVTIGTRRLILDFARNRWYGQLDEEALHRLCLEPLEFAPEIRVMDDWQPNGMEHRGHSEWTLAQAGFSNDRQPVDKQRSFRAEFILAQIGLWCSRGSLPKGVDLHATLSLRHWPNLPGLPRTYGAMQIAALWMQSPCSLANTVERTGLQQRHVFAFYAICHALNLFVDEAADGEAQPDAAPAAAAKKKPATTLGFLRNLMKAVWRSDDKNE